MQSRLLCGWILRWNVWWKKPLMLQNNLIYQHAKKSILEFIIRNPLHLSNPLLLNYSVSALSPGWSVTSVYLTFPMENHLQADSPMSTWIGSRKTPEHHCWNSWLCRQRALSALAERGFHFMASFKSGWALILLFLQPNNGKSRHWMRVWGVTAGLWFLLIKNTDCIHPFRKLMTKEC